MGEGPMSQGPLEKQTSSATLITYCWDLSL